MNRIAGRSGIVILMCILLLAGFVFFLCEYVAEAGEWVIFAGSPHVYNGGNLDCGVVTDRNSVLLLDMRGDRVYSADELIKKSVVHLLGDREGNDPHRGRRAQARLPGLRL